MNNRQTSRRRGRGNNRTQNNNRNGYDHQNRIDNRARGNAAQMLEKYKKLAQDAQLNGDRVQAEYYHQFADHYFRVLADYRSRQEENRPQRNEWRDDREGGEREWRDEDRSGEAAEFVDEETDGVDIEAELRSDEDGETVRAERNDRRPQRNNRNDRGDRNGNRNERGDRGERNDRNARGRNDRRDRYDNDRERGNEAEGIDMAVLPPAIGSFDDTPAEDAVAVEAEAKPARKPRAPRRPKSANDEEVVTAAE